jgi:AraC family transcriptional activator of pobA
MNDALPIPLHKPQSFIPKFFEPDPTLQGLLSAQPEQFFILRIEEMYRHLHGPVPPVRSSAHSALFITSGEARMTIGYDHYVAQANDLLLVPAGQIYSFRPADVNTGYLLHVHPDMLLAAGTGEFEFLTGWGQPLIHFGAVEAGFVQVLLQRLLAAYGQAGLGPLPLLWAYLAALFTEANYAYQPLTSTTTSAAASLAHAFKQLLSQHIRQVHRVAAYADLLHITPNHLNKAVKSITGKSPTTWIDEALVLEAKSLLFQTTLPVAEVAALVGIADASYFSRLFKKVEGHPPSALRRPAAPASF